MRRSFAILLVLLPVLQAGQSTILVPTQSTLVPTLRVGTPSGSQPPTLVSGSTLIPTQSTLVPTLRVGTPSGSQPQARDTGDGLTLEWSAPAPSLNRQPDGSVQVEMPGYDQLSRPGAPRVPFAAVLVALPPGASPTLQWTRLERSQMPLAAPLALAGRPQGVVEGPDGQVVGGAFTPVQGGLPFSPEPVVLERLGILRGVELARLVFYPVRPQDGILDIISRIRVFLNFNRWHRPEPVLPVSGDPLLASLRSAVINPQHLQLGSVLESVSPAAQAVQGETGPVAAVEVEQAGLVAVSFSDLSGIGFPVQNARLESFHLSRAGAEIPLEWDGNGNEVFEPGERLLFFAQPRFSRWSAADVYFLSLSASPGMLVQSRPAVPASRPPGVASAETLLEENIRYTPDCLCAPIPAGRDGDRWVWDSLQRPSLTSASYPFELFNPDLTKSASLKLWLIGYTDVAASPDHRVEVVLNGVPLGSVEWNGKQAVETVFSIPASTLKASGNQLSLALPGLPGVEVEGNWLDAFSVRYALSSSPAGDHLLFEGENSARTYTLGLANVAGLRAYDVTDPDKPLRLSGLAPNPTGQVSIGDTNSGLAHRYWITSETGLLSPTRLRMVSRLASIDTPGADYVIITPHEFRPALEGLVELRMQQGFSVLVEDVQAIFDAYGEGRPEPLAIKAFLAQAYAGWNPRPAYVLLVGDGTSDPRRYHSISSPTFIPPYLEEVDPWAGETAADNRYVTLQGDDILPDLLIGRLPVNSLAETQAVVDKIVRAELAPRLGDRIARAALVADDQDGGGDFPALSEEVASRWISPLLVSSRLYFTPPGQTPDGIRQALLQEWNAGAGLIMFTGHASVRQWAVERFFHVEDVAGLVNEDRLPLVLEMTCFTGSFHLPVLSALDESLLRHPSGGALAVWGPTGLGISTGHGDLADGFLESVLRNGQPRIGPAALAGKVNLMARHPEFSDLVDTFTLLGDPATQLPITPGTKPIYFPSMPN